jgi:DNA-binding MarR family transcriptional regulator
MDLYSVENCTCFNLRRVTRVITQCFDAEFRRYGIRITQTPILNALQARSGWSMAEMSDFLGMERTTLLRNLRPLQREGLIKISGGGRGVHVQLAITEKGRTAISKLLPAWRAAQEKVVAILGEKRWSTILGDFGRVATELTSRE